MPQLSRVLCVAAAVMGLAASAAVAQGPTPACDAQVQIIDVTRRQYEATVASIVASQLAEITRLKAEVDTLKKAAAEKDKKPVDKKPDEPKPADPPSP